MQPDISTHTPELQACKCLLVSFMFTPTFEVGYAGGVGAVVCVSVSGLTVYRSIGPKSTFPETRSVYFRLLLVREPAETFDFDHFPAKLGAAQLLIGSRGSWTVGNLLNVDFSDNKNNNTGVRVPKYSKGWTSPTKCDAQGKAVLPALATNQQQRCTLVKLTTSV